MEHNIGSVTLADFAELTADPDNIDLSGFGLDGLDEILKQLENSGDHASSDDGTGPRPETLEAFVGLLSASETPTTNPIFANQPQAVKKDKDQTILDYLATQEGFPSLVVQLPTFFRIWSFSPKGEKVTAAILFVSDVHKPDNNGPLYYHYAYGKTGKGNVLSSLLLDSSFWMWGTLDSMSIFVQCKNVVVDFIGRDQKWHLFFGDNYHLFERMPSHDMIASLLPAYGDPMGTPTETNRNASFVSKLHQIARSMSVFFNDTHKISVRSHLCVSGSGSRKRRPDDEQNTGTIRYFGKDLRIQNLYFAAHGYVQEPQTQQEAQIQPPEALPTQSDEGVFAVPAPMVRNRSASGEAISPAPAAKQPPKTVAEMLMHHGVPAVDIPEVLGYLVTAAKAAYTDVLKRAESKMQRRN
jgi:hypothetical protein